MPLSEHEQRLLEQIERALSHDDPQFEKTVRRATPGRHYRSRLVRSFAIILLGLVVLIVAMAMGSQTYSEIGVGVAGFAIMLFGALRAYQAVRRLSGRFDPPPVSTPTARRARRGKPHLRSVSGPGTPSAGGGRAPRARPRRGPSGGSLIERLAQRWERRWETGNF